MTISRIRRATVVLLTATALVGALLVLLPGTGRMAPSVPPVPLAEPLPRVAVVFNDGGTHDRFGIDCPQLELPGKRTEHKRLFYDPCGRGNQTVVDVNGYRYIFGDKYLGCPYIKNPKSGRKIRQTPIPGKSAWISAISLTPDSNMLEVTRAIEIVAGDTSRRLDTVRVKYRVKNTGKTDCTVALQTHLDTWIGTTNEVPFYVPPVGGRPGRLVDAKTVLVDDEVPDFVLARELDDLTDRQNTHVVLGLRLPGEEAPVKVTLCPAEQNWILPPAPPNELGVALNWVRANLQPGQTRTFGYTYGLGRLEIEKPAADPQIALQFVRAAAHESFPVIAHLRRGAQKQKVTLRLPEGVSLLPGEPAEKELDASGERNAVVWRVVTERSGRYQFAVDAPNHGAAKGTVEVRPNLSSLHFAQ